MGVTRDDVVAAAIDVLDDEGLDGLTLRRVATRLGVQAPTLYWHVRNKRELLDLMAVQMLSAHPPPAEPAHGQPWWEWLGQRAMAHRDALLAHRDGARVMAGNRPTEESWPRIEASLAALTAAGFPPAEALRSLLAIAAFVVGWVLEEQSDAERPQESRLAPFNGDVPPWLDDTRFPHLAAAHVAMANGQHRVFEHGLELLLEGLRRRHALLNSLLLEPGMPAGDETTLTSRGSDR